MPPPGRRDAQARRSRPALGESVYAVVFGQTQVTPDQLAAPFR